MNTAWRTFTRRQVKKSVVALSYISAAVVIGTLFCLLTFFAAVAYIGIGGGAMLSAGAVLKIIGYTFLNVCVFAIILYLLALFIKSTSAWSGIATVVGTLVGFVGGIYLPMGYLPDSVARVLKYLPVLHGASVMRKVCCGEILKETFAGLPEAVMDGYEEYMGITVNMNDKHVSTGTQLLFMIGYGCVALIFTIPCIKEKTSEPIEKRGRYESYDLRSFARRGRRDHCKMQSAERRYDAAFGEIQAGK